MLPAPAAASGAELPVLSRSSDLSPPSLPVHQAQPRVAEPMDPLRPHADTPDNMRLRGGERSAMCPGRFCFIIPCPIPCDFCII